MRKYLLTLSTIALFAIGFAASDEESTSSSSNATQKVEQKQETQESKRQARIKKVLEYAEIDGKADPYSSASSAEDCCKRKFISNFGTPSSDEDFEMYKLFKERYMKIWREKQDAKKKMDNF